RCSIAVTLLVVFGVLANNFVPGTGCKCLPLPKEMGHCRTNFLALVKYEGGQLSLLNEFSKTFKNTFQVPFEMKAITEWCLLSTCSPTSLRAAIRMARVCRASTPCPRHCIPQTVVSLWRRTKPI